MCAIIDRLPLGGILSLWRNDRSVAGEREERHRQIAAAAAALLLLSATGTTTLASDSMRSCAAPASSLGRWAELICMWLLSPLPPLSTLLLRLPPCSPCPCSDHTAQSADKVHWTQKREILMQKQQQAKKKVTTKSKKEQKQQEKKQKMANEHFKINAKLLSHDAVCGRRRRRHLCDCSCANVNVNSACDARVAVFAITYDIYMLNGQTGAASRCTLVVVCENDRTATKH